MSYGIAPAKNNKVVTYANGRTPDIIREVLDANSEASVWAQVMGFAQQFAKTYNGLHDLYWWVKDTIRYVEDPEGVQWIREPARLFADKKGDCKSMTLFLCAVARCMGIPYTIRFVTYSPYSKVVTHVYPIFHLDGRDVIMDAVWTDFDSHKNPFYLKKDYSFMEISRLSGIGEAQQAERIATNMAAAATHMTRVAANLTSVNDGVDVTTLTEAEAIAYLTGGAVAGIGSNLAAFTLPTITMGDGVNGIGANVFKKAGAAVKKVVTKATDAIKKALQGLLNWVFKTGLKNAGPFFLFSFIQRQVSKKVDAKRAKQQKIISFIAKTTGTSEAVVMASIADGIKAKTGKTPQEVLNAASRGETVAGIGVITPGMVTAALAVIEKIIAFFRKKKEDAPKIDAESGSDLSELAADTTQQNAPVANENAGIIPPNVPRMADKVQTAEPRDTNPTVENGGALVTQQDLQTAQQTAPANLTTDSTQKDNSMLMWGGVALVGLYLFSQNKK